MKSEELNRYYTGCSGYHYKHWKETFYPKGLPQKKWFEFYCKHFDTLELNVTFYRFPKTEVLKNWYDSCPGHFKFAVKAPRAITHFKKFNGTERMLDDFYHTVQEGLQEKLGCCLFQLPPNYMYSEDKLTRIADALHPEVPNVIEFRNDSWWKAGVYDLLATKNITFCGMSHPQLPQQIVHNTPLLYYRFHGNESLYSSKYSTADLENFANEIKSKDIRQAFIFFNNDIHTNAVYNAKELAGLLRS